MKTKHNNVVLSLNIESPNSIIIFTLTNIITAPIKNFSQIQFRREPNIIKFVVNMDPENVLSLLQGLTSAAQAIVAIILTTYTLMPMSLYVTTIP